MLNKINQTLNFLLERGIKQAEIGIILGTGLGKLIDEIKIEKSLDYKDIPNFPLATVEFHSGKLVYGELEGKKVIAMQGRFHFYEGYSMQEITFPVRVMKKLGIKYLLVSNAAGAMNLSFKKGTLMLIDDHINLLPENPLRGQNFEEFGPRFPDMSQPYSMELNYKLIQIAHENNIVLNKGIYVCVQGPNLETRAEYRYLNAAGADVVGMSTVPEVIVANHMGLPCAAVSVITDECDPDNLKPIDIEEIIAVAGEAEKDMIVLFKKLIAKLNITS